MMGKRESMTQMNLGNYEELHYDQIYHEAKTRGGD